MAKIKLNIADNIADTMLITLYAKAVETNKRDPLITDLTACRLVNEIDYDFSKYRNKTASSVGVALRASHFDNVVKQYIEGESNLLSINLFINILQPSLFPTHRIAHWFDIRFSCKCYAAKIQNFCDVRMKY